MKPLNALSHSIAVSLCTGNIGKRLFGDLILLLWCGAATKSSFLPMIHHNTLSLQCHKVTWLSEFFPEPKVMSSIGLFGLTSRQEELHNNVVPINKECHLNLPLRGEWSVFCLE